MTTLLAGCALTLTVLGSAGHVLAESRQTAIDLRQSRIEVKVKATGHSFTARLTKFNAAIKVNGDDVITDAQLAFRVVDLKTDNRRRDDEMQVWLNSGEFPDGSFELRSLEPAASGRLAGRGELTLHGTTREIRFDVTVLTDHGVIAVDGYANLDTREFGLPVIRKLGVLRVDPGLLVRFHLQSGGAGRTGSSLASPGLTTKR